jgi:hypothetical protein
MRFRLLLFAPVCFALFASNPKPSDLPLINRLNEIVQLRFKTPDPGLLGMSRITVPSSMGRHFRGLPTRDRDFLPENETEREVISKLEENGVQVGLYVFGAAVVTSPSDALNYRALKGPGVITKGTPPPAWYPGLPQVGAPATGALPDWKAVYPLARRAMQSFEDGGAGFETTLEGWNIAARPVVAEARCNICHNKISVLSKQPAKANEPIGGVLYAFRK